MEHSSYQITGDTSEIETIMKNELLSVSRTYVKTNETKICSSESALVVDLGTCVSVVLSGITNDGRLYFGANHLFKSREENSDKSLEQISLLYNDLHDRNVTRIQCIGVFGAGYREKSLASQVAQNNIITVLETLSLYKLDIEIFQTGFSQAVLLYHSQSLNSIVVRLKNLGERTFTYYKLPVKTIFGLAE